MENNTAQFDVLVVYTDGVATSASSKKISSQLPFSIASKRAHYNIAYAYFLDVCRKKKIKAAFTTSKDLISNGCFRSYWIYKNNNWKKVEKNCTAPLIFDRFSPINKKQKNRRLSLFESNLIKPFNHPEIFSLFFDKQKTFDTLFEYAIPTVTVKNRSYKSINYAFGKLKKLVEMHPNKQDFSSDVVVKDRFGTGGNSIYKVSQNSRISKTSKVMSIDKTLSFIIQPFANFDKGYKFAGVASYADIRIIYIGAEIIQAYVRTSKENDFRCNEHQGGSLEYISIKQIPAKVRRLSDKISNLVSKHASCYALDFVISNNGNVYLMEGNSGPGIYWNPLIKGDEIYSKKLIREIVNALSDRVYILNPQYIPFKKSKVPPAIPLLVV